MVNQDYMFVGGKPAASATRRAELTDARAQRSVAGRGRVSTYPVSFASQSGGLPQKADQTISMDDRHEEFADACPSELFLG